MLLKLQSIFKRNIFLTSLILGISSPTAIQQNCIPSILKGYDCVGAARTGSGKTLAFALPMLQKLSEDPYGIFALILTPTRELAYQVCNNMVNHYTDAGRHQGLENYIHEMRRSCPLYFRLHCL